VVAGSNLAAPTSNSRSKTITHSNPSSTSSDFVNKSVNNELTAELFQQLVLLQRRHGLSDRALARRLGISNTHLSYLRRGLRKPKLRLIDRIIVTFPQLKYLLPESVIFSQPIFASIVRGDTMEAKNCELEQLIQDFLVAKQVEDKTQKTLTFYGQNLNRILWWLSLNYCAGVLWPNWD